MNVTDAVNCPDSTCVLNPGDHPAIVKPSAVYYRKARLFESQKIDALIAEGKYIRGLAKCTPAILQKIISGAKSADDLTLKFLSYLP